MPPPSSIRVWPLRRTNGRGFDCLRSLVGVEHSRGKNSSYVYTPSCVCVCVCGGGGGEWVLVTNAPLYYTTSEFMDVNLRGQEWFNYT